MIVSFGKHKGKSVGLLVLKEPDYVVWLLSKDDLSGAALAVKNEALRLITIYDAKPIQRHCYGRECSSQATRCTVYMTNVFTPMWWCDACDPYQAGANDGKLQSIKTYQDVLDHISLFCNGHKGSRQDLIKILARAKGLPERVGETQVSAFFGA